MARNNPKFKRHIHIISNAKRTELTHWMSEVVRIYIIINIIHDSKFVPRRVRYISYKNGVCHILLFKIMSNMLKLVVVTFLISLSYKNQEHANVTIHRG